MQEDRAAEEVHHVPHWDKLGKGVDKETVEDAVFEMTVKDVETMGMHSPAKNPAAGQRYHKTEEMQSSSNEQKDSMSKEELLNEFFVLRRRVKELEDMTLKQTEVTGESRFDLPNISGKFSMVDKLPEKIQIRQDEIERLKKENNQLQREIQRGVEEKLLENTTGATEHVEKILPSQPPIQGDQVDEVPPDILGGVPNNGGGEVQGNQKVLDQDDAWQEVQSKVEKLSLDTTVTFAEDRETGKTAANIMESRLASSKPNQVQDGLDKRHCNYCGKKGHGSGSYLERKDKCKAFGKACRI